MNISEIVSQFKNYRFRVLMLNVATASARVVLVLYITVHEQIQTIRAFGFFNLVVWVFFMDSVFSILQNLSNSSTELRISVSIIGNNDH
jgi:O-glycosyl hydrolase